MVIFTKVSFFKVNHKVKEFMTFRLESIEENFEMECLKVKVKYNGILVTIIQVHLRMVNMMVKESTFGLMVENTQESIEMEYEKVRENCLFQINTKLMVNGQMECYREVNYTSKVMKSKKSKISKFDISINKRFFIDFRN